MSVPPPPPPVDGPPPPPPPVDGPPPGGYGGYGGYPGYGGYGYGREHPQGTTIMVIGILSIVLTLSCGIGVLLGPVAWVMGNTAIAEIDRDPLAYNNRSTVQAGRICGIVTTCLLILAIVILVFALIASAASVSPS